MEDSLGSLVWYTVEQDVMIEHIDFCRNLLEAGVLTTMPSAPKSSDVFKRACTQAHFDTGDGAYVTVPAGTDNDSVWRTIKFTSDTEDEQTLGRLEFNKVTDHVTAVEVTDVFAKQVVDSVVAYCAHNATMLTGYIVREHIRRVIEREFMAIKVRQGIYFVPAVHVDQLERVETVANLLGEGVSLHTVPIEKSEKQYLMVMDATYNHISTAATTVVLEIDSVIESDQNISKERFAQFNNEYEFLTAQTNLYANEFGSQWTAAIALKLALESVRDATHRVMGRIRV